MIYLKIQAKPLLGNLNSPLPVDVCRSVHQCTLWEKRSQVLLSGTVACFRDLGCRKEKQRKRARKKARQRTGKKGGMERIILLCLLPFFVCCVLRPLFFQLLSTKPIQNKLTAGYYMDPASIQAIMISLRRFPRPSPSIHWMTYPRQTGRPRDPKRIRPRGIIRGCQHRQRVRVLERDQRFCVLRIRSAHLHVFKSSCQVALRRVLTKNSKWVERLGRAGFQR